VSQFPLDFSFTFIQNFDLQCVEWDVKPYCTSTILVPNLCILSRQSKTFNSLTVTGEGVKLSQASFLHPVRQPLGIFLIALVTGDIRGVRLCSASGSKIQHGSRKTGSCVGWMVVCWVWQFIGLLRMSFSWYFDSMLLILLNNKLKTIRCLNRK